MSLPAPASSLSSTYTRTDFMPGSSVVGHSAPVTWQSPISIAFPPVWFPVCGFAISASMEGRVGMGANVRPRGRVLMVDDDPIVCDLVETTRTEHGYPTRRAADGPSMGHALSTWAMAPRRPAVSLWSQTSRAPDSRSPLAAPRCRRCPSPTAGSLSSGQRSLESDDAAGHGPAASPFLPQRSDVPA